MLLEVCFAKERFCRMEDAQTAAGFGSQLYYVICPGGILADDEAQRFVGLNFLKWFVKEVDGRVHQAILSK